jgi:hypothetical protein
MLMQDWCSDVTVCIAPDTVAAEAALLQAAVRWQSLLSISVCTCVMLILSVQHN